jgi:ribosome maturation factor RimP
LIEPEAEAEGLALVRVKMIGGASDPTLQVMAERPDTRQLSLEECARLSRRLSDLLDALEEQGADPIEISYRLEFSSPGIDRPLTTRWSTALDGAVVFREERPPARIDRPAP